MQSARLQAPARSNGAYRFPVRRSPAGFVPRVMRPIGLGARSDTDLVLHPVVIEDPKGRIDPRRTPPLPVEGPAASRPHHVAPHLLLDPGPYELEAPRRVPNPEVVHPAPQDRVDHRDNLPDRPRVPAPKHLLELPHQRRPLLDARRLLHRSRRKVKPKNPNASPCVRSATRLFASFTRRSSFANSSRRRRPTALSRPPFRHWPFTRITRSSA